MNNKHNILSTDGFKKDLYPQVVREINDICAGIARVPGEYKSEVLISFLKDHCIKIEWLVDNAKFIKVITSRSLKSSHTESLFESCRSNKIFLKGFEAYIESQVKTSIRYQS
jgi:hypothetical protein